MAVTPLGILGSAVNDDPGGSSDTLDIPLTTGILASDVTTSRMVVVRTIVVASPGVNPDTYTDDAVLTEPNVCYGPNDYTVSTSGALAFGHDPSTRAVVIAAQIVQPLPAGKTVSIIFDGVYDYARGWVFGYEGAGWGPDPQAWSDYFPLAPPAGGCQSVPNVYDVVDTYANLLAIEDVTTGVSAITFVDGAITVLDDFYDWAGGSHVSGAVGDGPVALVGDIGACTDQFPVSSLDFTGDMMPVGEQGGIDPCPDVFGVQASVGDFV